MLKDCGGSRYGRHGPGSRVALVAAFGILLAPQAALAQDEGAGRRMPTMAMSDTTGVVWRMPPLRRPMPMMLPSLMGAVPPVTPFLPGVDLDPATIPDAVFFEIVEMAGGDTLHLEAGFVRRRIGARTFTMYGFNGQYPGPLIRVPQGAEIVVLFTNAIDLPTTVHWHGVRLDNRYDGVPGVTQDPVEPGESFVYRVRSPTPDCIGTTRISARTSSRTWVSTETWSSLRPSPTISVR